MSKNDNAILIGMPGAGKSTIGVVLAKRIGFRFVDSDLVIQDKENMLLHEIIESKGLKGFLETEDRINSAIFETGAVIATGGSVVYGQNAMEHFREIGTVIYLQLPYAEIENRLGDLKERGVALKDGQTLQSLYEERAPLYEKYADMVIDCNGKQIRDIVMEIAERLQENK